MTNIILDTNIIIRFPQILGLSIDNTKLLIPNSVVDELNYVGKQKNSIVDLIDYSLKSGSVQIVDTLSLLKEYQGKIINSKLSIVDKSLIALALSLKDKKQDVKIASQDKIIQLTATENNIGFLNWDSVLELLKSKKSKDETPLNLKIATYENKNLRSYLTGILTGVLSSVLASVIYKNLQLILSTINIWGTIVLILLLGVGLFIYREKQRLSYGIFEITVGVIAIISLFTPVDFSYKELTFDLNFNLKLLGGLYIMVRGQDNVLKAIRNKKLGLWIKDKIGI